ncbi:pectinesterase inhibitor 2-like [Malania oleifera]|uniref:pectinesterase inhibitor 2-like n=1 Tax=Malania oleifera TaxID=397392 RepID=UPI0025AE022F|nr:pectinesterase inhibitor 2-like [Malania oleifera]
MDTKLISILIFTITMVLATPHGGSATDDVIAQACNRAMYKDFCVALLKSDPESENADLPTLGTIALKLARSNATYIQNDIQKLLNPNSNPSLKLSLHDCAENYEEAGDHLQESVSAFGSKRYNDVLTWVSAAMGNADSCAEGFKDLKRQSPIAAMNENFNKLCSSVLAIVNVIAER